MRPQCLRLEFGAAALKFLPAGHDTSPAFKLDKIRKKCVNKNILFNVDGRQNGAKQFKTLA